ncbi:MAG TPA: HDIG domain-containing metalloprotein [Drouetiella sp.]
MAIQEPEPVDPSQNSDKAQSSQSTQSVVAKADEKPVSKSSGAEADGAKNSGKRSDNSSNELHQEKFSQDNSLFNWLTVCVLGYVALVFALGAHHIYNKQYRAGDIAEHDLIATHASLVVDDGATKIAQDRARREVMPVFKANRDQDEKTQNVIANLLNGIGKIHTAGIAALPEKSRLVAQDYTNILDSDDAGFESQAKSVAAHLNTTEAELQTQHSIVKKLKSEEVLVSPYQLTIALSVPDSDFPQYKNIAEKTAHRILQTFHRLPENPTVWAEIASEFLPDNWSAPLKQATAQLISAQLQPNMEVDLVATENKAASNAATVKPVMKQITVGQLIVKKNAIIKQQDADLLEAMGVSESNRWPYVLGLAMALAAAVILIGVFLFAFEQTHLFSTSSVGLMYTVTVVVFTMAALFGKNFPQIVPLPAASLILTIFLGQRISTALTVCTAIFLGADSLIDMTSLIALCAASGAAIGFYSKKRHALMSTGIIMAVAQALGFAIATCVQGGAAPTTLVKGFTLDFFGGIILAIVSIGSLPFLESIFGMLTPFRLAELTDADQPLLRKLEENAPGTYQHSLAVANLAEAGARDIGADVNLVRAGALYHDVGKMVRPKYFIENQLGDKNPHDSMSPEDSRERVLAHVTDGIALAKEYGLPKAVQDFIPMHQGTSLMAYFYHKACLRDGADKVDPLFYRYPGPKPQSKETSIVMLADVSEAVTHSMKDPSQEEVEEAMTKVFQNRWDDGQFNESTLTYPELMNVKKAFVHVWRTLHHERLKYPSTTTGRMAVPPEAVPASASSTVDQKHPDADS